MRQWAEKASGQLDSKVKCLIDWLNTHIRPGKKWGHERVILFTEYRATQNWLQGSPRPARLHQATTGC